MGNRGHRKRRLKAQEADAFTKVCLCLWGSLGGRSERSLDQSSVLCKVGWGACKRGCQVLQRGPSQPQSSVLGSHLPSF